MSSRDAVTCQRRQQTWTKSRDCVFARRHWVPGSDRAPSCASSVYSGTRSWSVAQWGQGRARVQCGACVWGRNCIETPSPVPTSAVCCTSVYLASSVMSWDLDIYIQPWKNRVPLTLTPACLYYIIMWPWILDFRVFNVFLILFKQATVPSF